MRGDFVLMTDDFCDLPRQWLGERGIPSVPTSCMVDGTTYRSGDISEKEFYAMLREGKTATTSAANSEDIKLIMEEHLKAGKDVLYITFSSGLSATYQSGEMAAAELREAYPDRKIIVIDSLCASMGQGLFVRNVHKVKETGAGIDETAEWAIKNRLHVAHYFMADDLMHLHRGGRVSKASAIAGSMLGIKPVLNVNDEGKLIPVDKKRGKKQALEDLVDKFGKVVGNTKSDLFMVSHADCEEDARFVAELVSKRFGVKDCVINYIGTTIGSHTGPGAVALFMMADRR